MIGPFLHRVLPYRRLIMLDADLLFRVDIAKLHSLFDDFSGAEVMGVGPDLAPHYYHVLRFYREANPGTDIGSPGRFQGFNTGVVLYDLDRMRGSAVYKAYTTNEGGCVDKLAEKYVYKSHLGDQVGDFTHTWTKGKGLRIGPPITTQLPIVYVHGFPYINRLNILPLKV